ncbi:NAD(P)H-binding protein [Saccharomonospora sp. NPDC046836]|uniref:NmrA family NAD(P)-binding protein n=1 Tax=Saccharomonospora sp. NPDC046836 TaxID=3156921 RepID=UPI00340AB8E2
MRVLVTGATGTVGRPLVNQLASAGVSVRALTRNPVKASLPDGVEVVGGDLTDLSSLRGALDGVDAVHLITFDGEAGEVLPTGREIVELCVHAGVTRASVLAGWDRSALEDALDSSTLSWTRIAPKEFMANALEWAPLVREEGIVRTMASWPSAVVHEADIAAVAAVALTQDGHGGRTYLLTGPEALTAAQRTKLIGEAIGRHVEFVELTEEQERERLRSYGYSEDYVEFGIQLAAHPPEGAAVVLPTIEQVTGHAARTFAQWATDHAPAFRS